MMRIFDGDKNNKVRKLMDYTEQGRNVADPWYSRRFDIAYNDIYNGCKELLDRLIKQGNFFCCETAKHLK